MRSKNFRNVGPCQSNTVHQGARSRFQASGPGVTVIRPRVVPLQSLLHIYKILPWKSQQLKRWVLCDLLRRHKCVWELAG